MEKVDLHIHTKYSDGILSLEEVLNDAKKNNITELSITDHDTIINLKDYRDLKKKYGINIIPGVEISTNKRGMHILGYDITEFDQIEKFMYNLKKINEEKNIETIDILYKLGLDIDFERVKKMAVLDVITYKDIVKYIVKKGYVDNPHDVYKKYIGKGAPAYVPSITLEPKEVIELILNSNGIPVLAHPFLLDSNISLEEEIISLINYGLEGIETIQPCMTQKQILEYEYYAKRFKLIRTVGSDFHDYRNSNLGIEVDDSYLDKFHDKVMKKRRV